MAVGWRGGGQSGPPASCCSLGPNCNSPSCLHTESQPAPQTAWISTAVRGHITLCLSVQEKETAQRRGLCAPVHVLNSRKLFVLYFASLLRQGTLRVSKWINNIAFYRGVLKLLFLYKLHRNQMIDENLLFTSISTEKGRKNNIFQMFAFSKAYVTNGNVSQR